MKQPKKPTWTQKQELSRAGLDPKEWAVISDRPLMIIHRQTGEKRVLNE